LVVISQRPSEVNHTVLSQCNNLVTMRLTNGEDQSVVRKLLPVLSPIKDEPTPHRNADPLIGF
ncbi:MAG: hypothetical protein Q8N70_06635, partial [Deltaproteobacteria bacterium]|nr:hypothetical protein [Deltaproteobacteria bacterium]